MTPEQRMEKLKSNYDAYRNQFETYTIKNAALGDIITLYAKPDPGYTVQWRTNTGTQITEQQMVSNLPHIGSSFSFQVAGDEQDVSYYFTPINDVGKKILKGKVIRSLDTIKRQSAYSVDIRRPDTYKGVPGASVSVATADSSDAYIDLVEGGNTVRYSTTATTDENGEFSIYVPYGADDALYSLKLLSGEKAYAKSVLVDKYMYLQIPFMDDLKVTGMEISGLDDSSKLTISNRQEKLTVYTRGDSGRTVTKVKFRSYDASGGLWTEVDAVKVAGNVFRWTTNVKESFKDGGRITVELFDERGEGHGEIESGYTLIEPPSEGEVSLPDVDSIGKGVDLSAIGNVNPDTSLGNFRSLKPVSIDDENKTYAIAINGGKTIKKAIEDNADEFDSKTIAQKSAILMEYLDGRYNQALKYKDDKAEKIEKGDSKIRTGKGRSTMYIGFDVGVYLQLTKKTVEGQVRYYFDYAFIMGSANINVRKDFQAIICAVPVYLSLHAGGEIEAFVAAQGGEKTSALMPDEGWFPKEFDSSGIKLFGNIHANIYINIGAGAGVRGALSVGARGKLDLDLTYQPLSNGAGTVTFGLGVDIDILFIPISFTVAEKTFQMFKTDGYIENAWQPEENPESVEAAALKTAAVKALESNQSNLRTLERADNMSDWLGNNTHTLYSMTANNIGGILSAQSDMRSSADVLQTGIYKHPQPQIIPLGSDKMLMVFLGDDLKRDGYDRTAVYYSIYDGIQWSEPIILQDDGTADNEPSVADTGNGKILITWTSSNRIFGNEQPQVKDLLNSMDIYSVFFDKATCSVEGEIAQLTDDKGGYSNSLPKVAFDTDTDKVMVMYTKTDYNTPGVEFDPNNVEAVGDFIHNSYSLIAYRIYKNGQWQTSYYDDETQYTEYENEHGEGSLNGQRFIDFDIPSVIESAKISESAASSYNGLTLYAYTLDVDQDPLTKDDTEIFMMIYNYSERSISHPIRITDNTTPDENPQITRYDQKSYLYWNANGRISYIDLSGLVKNGLTKTTSDGKDYYVPIEGYKYPIYATDTTNNDAASSFKVTIGNDGNMYLVWSESGDTIPDLNNPENRIGERQLYVAMYDARHSIVKSDDGGETGYIGAWGDRFKLTDNPGEFNNEQDIAVDENGKIFIVNRRFKVVDDWNGSTRESDTSSLVARIFEPDSVLSIDDEDISIYPKYPRPNDNVSVTAEVENSGLSPAQDINFKFSVIDGGTESQVSQSVADNVYLVSGGKTVFYGDVTMPDNTDNVKIRLKAWEGTNESSAIIKEIPINKGYSLGIEDEEAYFIDNSRLNVTGKILNTGNETVENVTVSLEKIKSKSMLNAVMADTQEESDMPDPVVLKEIPRSSIAPGEVVGVYETIDIPDDFYDSSGDAQIALKAKLQIAEGDETKDTTIAGKYLFVHSDDLISDITVDGINQQNLGIKIQEGSGKYLNAKAAARDGYDTYELKYESSNPSIVNVSLSGFISGRSKGSAEIYIKAYDTQEALLNSASNKVYSCNNTAVGFDEDGKPVDALMNNDEDILFTKTVNVDVIDNNEDDDSNSGQDVKEKLVDVFLEGDLTKVKVESKALKSAIEQAAKDDSNENKRVQLNIEDEMTSQIEITLPQNEADDIVENSLGLEILTRDIGVLIDSKAMKSITKRSDKDITLTVEKIQKDNLPKDIQEVVGERPVVDINIKSGETQFTDFEGGKIDITIPYEAGKDEKLSAIIIYYINEKGNVVPVKASEYNRETKTVTFKTSHLSMYSVGYNLPKFDDIETHWANDWILYLAARGVVSGRENNSFVPNDSITRAEFLKIVIGSIEGIDINSANKAGFKDVQDNKWYSSYINWSAENEIIKGKGNGTFGPNEELTREQMTVILLRFINSVGVKLDSSSDYKTFIDENEISDWAVNAVKKAQEAGILKGKSEGQFDPKGITTRAEVSKVVAEIMRTILNEE